MERTLAIIKPDAFEGDAAGPIVARIQEEGFRIAGMRLVHLSRTDAEGFYAVHRERPFFNDLVSFMSSGPAVVMALEADNAIARWRDVIGATDPSKAAEGTIRKLYATNIERNAVHGSDAPDTARTEIAYFFRSLELV
jgi:nucleoside-diphosphate kinase